MLHRKMRDWQWYKVPNTKDTFLELLLSANWKDTKYRTETIPRGSVLTTMSKIAEATGLTKDEVRTALNHLKTSHDISHTKMYNELLITIHNYDYYQSSDMGESEQVPTGDPTRFPHDSHTVPTHPDKEEREEREEGTPIVPYGDIVNAYNTTCTNLPTVTRLSDARKKAMSARFNSGYRMEDFEKLFQMAEASRFLKGGNNRNWRADFDWLIRDANMAKVLDGKYSEQEAANGNCVAIPGITSV